MTRIAKRKTYTIGRLEIEGAGENLYFCDTLEPTWRDYAHCLALKNVESKTTFKNGENRRFRFVGVAGTRTKAQKRQKAQVFG